MSRQSSIKKLSPEARHFIEKLLRDDVHSLDEMLMLIRTQFPSDELPSRSSLGRYRQSLDEMMGRMRDIQDASRVLVSELGEDIDDKAGALLAQAVTTMAVNVAMTKNDPDAKVSIKDVGELARAARAVMQARTMSLKERLAIEAGARDKLIKEQKQKLEALVRKAGLSDDTANEIKSKILGIV